MKTVKKIWYIPPELIFEIGRVRLVVAEKRFGLDPVDDRLAHGDGNLELDVRSFVVAANSQLKENSFVIWLRF